MDVSKTGRDGGGGGRTCFGITARIVEGAATADLGRGVDLADACRAVVTILVQLHILYSIPLKYKKVKRATVENRNNIRP